MYKMFCDQCEEFLTPAGCTVSGVCGKNSRLSNLQDMLVDRLRELSGYTHRIRGMGIEYQEFNRFICRNLFMTTTNTNFDEERFVARIRKAGHLIGEATEVWARFSRKAVPGKPEEWTDEEICRTAEQPCERISGEDRERNSLASSVIYGLKGIAAYTERANRLEFYDPDIHAFIQRALVATADPVTTTEELYDLLEECGRVGLQAMSLLDKAHVSRYGEPEPTEVETGTRHRPGILVSGHDLRDLEELLVQTEHKGIDVYTHGEMLPAHAYPFFRKFPHFAGNYGNSWWRQEHEFASFNGPVLITTNCLVPPRKKIPRNLFTTGAVGYPSYPYIEDNDHAKDFSPLIGQVLASAPPRQIERGFIHTGYAHERMMELLPRIAAKLRNGEISKIFIMAGCDGRMTEREYYTEFASLLPGDTLILTAGCAKYRYNKLPLGETDGIPRVLDAGQCNDTFSIILFLRQLALALDSTELPVVFNMAWYEQKSVLLILSLLSLGFQNITIGPKIPAFFSPEVMNRLVRRYGLGGISSVENDLFYMAGKIPEYTYN